MTFSMITLSLIMTHYAECRILIVVNLNVIMRNVVCWVSLCYLHCRQKIAHLPTPSVTNKKSFTTTMARTPRDQNSLPWSPSGVAWPGSTSGTGSWAGTTSSRQWTAATRYPIKAIKWSEMIFHKNFKRKFNSNKHLLFNHTQDLIKTLIKHSFISFCDLINNCNVQMFCKKIFSKKFDLFWTTTVFL